jgi:hypothetical protein
MFALIPEMPIAPKKHSVAPLIIILVLLIGGIGAWFYFSNQLGIRSSLSPSVVLSQPQVEAPGEEVGPIGETEVFDGGLYQFTYPVSLVVEKDQSGTVVIQPKQGQEFVMFIKQTEQPLAEYDTTSKTPYLGISQVALSADAPTGTVSARGNTADWLFEGKFATYRITVDPSGSVRGLTGKEQQTVNLILSTLTEKNSPLVEQYFWRGTDAVPLTFYYPKALHVTSTSRGVELSTDRILARGCVGERAATCPLAGYTFRFTFVPDIDDVTDKCRGTASSTYPNILQVVPKKNAPASCAKTGFVNSWVFTGKDGSYVIAEDRVGEAFDVPFDYTEKQLLTTLKEK